MTAKLSPFRRASVSCGRSSRANRRAMLRRTESPTANPMLSFTCLNRSMFSISTVGRIASSLRENTSAASKRSMNNSRFGRPVRLSCTASCSNRSSDVLVLVISDRVPTTRRTSLSSPTTGRAFSAYQRNSPSAERNLKSRAIRPRLWSRIASSVARYRSLSRGCTTSIQGAAPPSSEPRLR